MRMLKVASLATVVAIEAFGLSALSPSAYAQESYWQGAPNASGPDAQKQSYGWRADTSMGASSGLRIHRGTGYALGPGSNGPSSINNGK